jgi:hypothetical protein
VADLSELKVQLTLSLDELEQVVGLLHVAGECIPPDDRPDIIEELSTMYFQMMEQLNDGNLGDFEPE